MSAAEHQLLRDLNEYFENFKVTLSDLRNPTEEFVRNFYCYYLSEFEVDPNNVEQIHFSQTVGITSYQDAFTGLIPKLNLMKAMKELNVISDFGLRDIINPTPRRTQQVLRALLNFYQWADQNVGTLNEKRNNLGYSERKKTMAELLSKKYLLKERQHNIFKDVGHLHMEKAKHKEEYDTTKEKFDKIRLAKEVAKKESEEPASKHKEKENTLHKLDKEIGQVRNKIKECSSQIIESPTVMLGDLKSLREKQKELKKNRDEKRDTVESKMKTLKTVRQGVEDQHQRAEKLGELIKLINQSKKALQELSTTEKNVAIQQDNLNELKNTVVKWEEKKQDRNNFYEKLIMKGEKIIPELKQCLEAVKSELRAKKNEKKNLRDRLKDKGAIQEKIEAALGEIEIITTDSIAYFNLLKKREVEEYDMRMAAYQAELEYVENFHLQ